MEPDELVLSDVHVYCSDVSSSHQELVTTCFNFLIADNERNSDDIPDVASDATDKDGDVEVTRKRPSSICLLIEHRMATTLDNVGLQAWNGALYLCDYLLHNPDLLKDKVVIELGAGVGLCSIIAARYAKQVFVTDHQPEVLRLCCDNIRRNCDNMDHVCVRKLDWTEPTLKYGLNGWSEQDVIAAVHSSVLLAADVIYDEGLTTHFFQAVHMLMSHKPEKILLLALEKRYNFTMSDLDVVATSYQAFDACLAELRDYEGDFLYNIRKIPNTLPSYSEYPHSKDMELWEISTTWRVNSTPENQKKISE